MSPCTLVVADQDCIEYLISREERGGLAAETTILKVPFWARRGHVKMEQLQPDIGRSSVEEPRPLQTHVEQ